MQAEQPRVVAGVADRQVHAAPDRAGQIGHEVGGDGDCIGFRAFAAGMGHVADQAIQARRIGHGRIAMRDHRRLSAVIGIVRR
ncbi:MAG: hypothetical protein ACRC1O_03650 [Ralstonia mannitolilytica]